MTELRYFSHTDLDGVMSAAALIAGTKDQYPDATVTYSFESTGSFGSIDRAITDWLATAPEAAYIGITDLTPSPDVLTALATYAHDHQCVVEVIDHHASTAHLATDFPFITNYNEHANGKQTCATSMVAERYPVADNAPLIIEAVRELDTWDWHNNPDSALTAELAQKLAIAVNLLGKDAFMQQIPAFNAAAKQAPTPTCATIFGPVLNAIIDKQLLDVDKYVGRKKDAAAFMDLHIGDHTYHVAYVQASKNMSEVGNMLAELPAADFGIVVNGNRLSLRSSEAADVDLATVAAAFQGGGHQHAAGGRLLIDYAQIIQASVVTPPTK